MVHFPTPPVRGLALLAVITTTAFGCDDPGPTVIDHTERDPSPELKTIDGSWRRGPDIPRGLFRPEVHYHGGMIYLVGGATVFYGSDSGTTDHLWVLDPAGGDWQRETDYPVDGMRISLMSRGDTLYGVGGQRFPGGRWDRLFRLAPGSDEWERMPFEDGPVGRLDWESVGDRHLVLWEEGEGQLYEFHPEDLTWTELAPMTLARADIAWVSVNGIPYAVFGKDLAVIVTQGTYIDRYDPVANTWNRATSAYASRTDPGVAVLNGRIHVVGGRSSDSPRTTDHFAYDPEQDEWFRAPDLPMPHVGLFGVEVDGELWFMGGGSDGAPNGLSREVWVFTPAGVP